MTEQTKRILLSSSLHRVLVSVPIYAFAAAAPLNEPSATERPDFANSHEVWELRKAKVTIGSVVIDKDWKMPVRGDVVHVMGSECLVEEVTVLQETQELLLNLWVEEKRDTSLWK